MKLMVFCVALALSSVASADWHKETIKDEMRGTARAVYLTEARPLDGTSPSIQLRVVEDPDGRHGVIFSPEGAMFETCSSLCDVEFRFDDGKVRKISFSSKDGRFAVPTESVSFAGAIKLSKYLFIEFALAGGKKAQYKFEVSGLPIDVNVGPEVNVIGYVLGRRYAEDEISLKKYRDANGVACYSGGDNQKPFGTKTVEKVSLCFSGGYFQTALITPGNKSSYAEGVAFLTKTLGPAEKDSFMPRWPDRGDKLIDRQTKNATYFSSSKNDYKSQFILSDGVSELLAQ